MSQRRGTTTDQLANIIQVLQLGRKTGRLTVERGQGMTTEQGEIVFVHGQITASRTGQITGPQALQRLGTWGVCRFLFVPAETERSTGPLTALPPTAASPSSRDTNPSLRTLAPSQMGVAQRAQTGQYPPIPPGMLPPQRIRQDNEALHYLTRAGLSRVHLRLFLLIDGRRSITELVRLMGRGPEEVQHLLHDLEIVGVIQQ